MTKAVILIIEDDPEIQELLSYSMSREGWKLLQARTGEEGLKILKEMSVNCILLDIMLPGMDGLKVLKAIKEIEQCRNVPVIMTTAKGEESDIITGLELGADDYVVKPYSPKVLIARVRAGLRRQEESDSGSVVTFWQQGELKLDTARHAAFNGEKQLELSATEFSLLKHFLSNPEIVFSRNQIISAIHGTDYPVTDRSVDVQILSLRKKLDEASSGKPGGKLIETIRGVGYRFKCPGKDLKNDAKK
jgi:two-component system phosphate regulon response regulator PhoB